MIYVINYIDYFIEEQYDGLEKSYFIDKESAVKFLEDNNYVLEQGNSYREKTLGCYYAEIIELKQYKE